MSGLNLDNDAGRVLTSSISGKEIAKTAAHSSGDHYDGESMD
jgi:hypothetical protein